MKQILYFSLVALTFIACQQYVSFEEGVGECILELDVSRAERPVVTSRAIEAGLAITILDAEGEVYKMYQSGDIPNKIVLEPGIFTVCAHSENLSTWHTANGGKGEACYFARRQVEMRFDSRTSLVMSVPMINYAVGVELPELFENLFSSYRFTLKSGGREVDIREGDKAYFSLSDGGFSYALRITNTDGVTHAHSPILFTDVQNGKLYQLRYNYDSNATSGSVDIEITDDMEMDDTIVDL